MAAGIAHELNTPLTYILGNLELLSAQEMPPSQRESLESIEKGAQRLNSLAHNLLAFSRPAKEEPSILDINELLGRCLELCHYHILKNNVTVETHLAPTLPKIRAIQGQIDTALINLMINALQVMHGGGRLTISTASVPPDMAEIQIADTGPGIPEEVRASIFEPFVTTKAEGQGTGLGLSTTLMIVEQHHGHIDFTTEPGVGTTFRVALPVASDETPAPERT
jgi:signal transduction histidine kinase